MMKSTTRLLFAACLLTAPLTAPAVAQPAAPPGLDEQAIAAQEAQATARVGHMARHQAFGLATLGGLATTAGLGVAVANAMLPPGWEYVHIGAATLTTGLYLTTGGLALTAPHSPFAVEQAGWSSVKIHESLAWLHAAGMASTVGLGLASFFIGSQYTEWHEAAAFTTLGLVGLSAGVIAFGN